MKASVVMFRSTREEPTSECSDDCALRSGGAATSATMPLTDGLSIALAITARLSESHYDIVARRKLTLWFDARVLLAGVARRRRDSDEPRTEERKGIQGTDSTAIAV